MFLNSDKRGANAQKRPVEASPISGRHGWIGSDADLVGEAIPWPGQRDRVANEHSGRDGKPFDVVLYLRDNGGDTNAGAAPAAIEEPLQTALRLA
jgi:hypothetical protein